MNHRKKILLFLALLTLTSHTMKPRVSQKTYSKEESAFQINKVQKALDSAKSIRLYPDELTIDVEIMKSSDATPGDVIGVSLYLNNDMSLKTVQLLLKISHSFLYGTLFRNFPVEQLTKYEGLTKIVKKIALLIPLNEEDENYAKYKQIRDNLLKIVKTSLQEK